MVDPLARRPWRAELAVQAVADFEALVRRAERSARGFEAWNPVAAEWWADKLDELRRDHERLAEEVGERLVARL